MSSARRAVIDVGTNSVKVLVADVAGREVLPVWEASKQTRLGSGFYQTHRLGADAIAKTARAVAWFTAAAHQHNATSVRAIATSAARDATNAADLVAAIEAASGLTVEIISGDQEAEWAFNGVTTDPALAATPLLILEVGGGSTQLIFGHGRHSHFQDSFPLGTVRVLEQMPHHDPPTPADLEACRQWVGDFVRREVQPKLEPAIRREMPAGSVPDRPLLVGTGGTATILGRIEARLGDYDRVRLEAARLTLDTVRAHLQRLWSLPIEERRQIVGLPKKRADVILPGVVIYEAVMTAFGFGELRVSTRGPRFGAVLDELQPTRRHQSAPHRPTP